MERGDVVDGRGMTGEEVERGRRRAKEWGWRGGEGFGVVGRWRSGEVECYWIVME